MSNPARISAYTPSNVAPELLKRIFVQREQLLNRLEDRLFTSMTTGTKHHILLVGPRGSGKTHLVALSLAELERNPKLVDTMRIAWLGEDTAYPSLVHFAFSIAQSLSEKYPNEFPSDFKSRVRGLPPHDAARAVLNNIVEQLKHRHLLLVTENLDQTFLSIGDLGQKQLRAFFQETRRIATLTTSQQLTESISSRKEPFFGFFDIQHLAPLTVEDALTLMKKIAVEQNRLEFARFLESNTANYRIQAIHHLAGGNHRLFVMLAESLTHESLDALTDAFETLSEKLTPHFQERLRWLPDQQRQLVQCLCNTQGALTVKEIAEETFVTESVCSKQLGNLRAKGLVRSEKRGKESYYDISEPLMRLGLEVKNQRGKPLRLVAGFLKAWFSEDSPRTPMSLEAESWHATALLGAGSFEAAFKQLGKVFREADPASIDREINPAAWAAAIFDAGQPQWERHIPRITDLFVKQGRMETLGRIITESIRVLDARERTAKELELWLECWRRAALLHDELKLPLVCLAAAVEVMSSNPKTDRPLFRLPLEIRVLIRQLLPHTLPAN